MAEQTIYLTESDADKFKLFLKNYHMLSVFLEHGVFENKSGDKSASITFNFDHLGNLQTVQRSDMIYSKKFDLVVMP